jgi:tetratricopeptide (TPR) repeat protein
MGVLLYHLLTAKYPVDAPTLPEFAVLHQTNKRRSLYEERTDVPDQLVSVIETATRRNPAERFRSTGQMLSALSESLGTGSVQTANQTSAPPKKRVYWWLAVPALVFAGAIVWLIPFLRSDPAMVNTTVNNGAHASYLVAQQYLDNYYVPHNLDKAIAGFRQTVDKDPQFALGYGGLCRAFYIEYRDLETPELLGNAQAACSKALEWDHGLASVHVTLGMLYTLMTNNSLAKQELDAALALDKRSSEVYGALGDLYAKQGRSDDVEPAYQTARDLAPRDWRWPKQLGDYYRDNGRWEDAAKQYQIAAGLTPDNSRVWNNLGIVYRRQGKFADAEKALREAIRLDPTAYNYFLNLGAVTEQEGNYPEAVNLYLQASALHPSDYLTLANLASAYDRIPGDHDKARENYLKAIALAEEERKKKPDDATLLAQLGSYYATIDMADQSLPLLRQAVALEPENPQVLYRAAEGYELLHQRDQALYWIGKALGKKYSLEALKRNPEMAALIADRRFAAIAAKSQ